MVTMLPPLPKRPADGHKGTFGKVLICGGSNGMAGSVSLAGVSALRSGAGLVTLAIPQTIAGTVSAIEPSYMTIPLADDSQGRITCDGVALLEERLVGMDVGAIGPGLGRSPDLDRLVSQLYRTSKQALVFDADAINALADKTEILSDHAGPRVLTPHPGEFSRLLGIGIEQVQANREELAMEFAVGHQLTVVLKGPGTVVADGQYCYVNETGNAGMATGGTGDILTGIIVSLTGQGMEPFEAAALAVYVHGLAGDLAAEELSQRGMIASDLIEFLPYAWRNLESQM